MTVLMRMLLALCGPLVLTGCFLSPGKFVSTLDVRADRSFTFTYVGQVIAFEADSALPSGMNQEPDAEESDKGSGSVLAPGAKAQPVAFQDSGPSSDRTSDAAQSQAAKDAKMRAMAQALAKEHGYRSVRYAGNNVFDIDYAISGRLNHGFLYPFNIDAEIIFPFIAIELRGADRLRIKAPGYANAEGRGQGGMGGGPMGMGGAKKMDEALDGVFTLTTDAEIVSQNQEEGAQAHPRGKTITWKVNALTKDAPSAVLRVVPQK